MTASMTSKSSPKFFILFFCVLIVTFYSLLLAPLEAGVFVSLEIFVIWPLADTTFVETGLAKSRCDRLTRASSKIQWGSAAKLVSIVTFAAEASIIARETFMITFGNQT